MTLQRTHSATPSLSQEALSNRFLSIPTVEMSAARLPHEFVFP
jgi:hypothetical protein